jgi:hypothetical protein
LIASRRGAAPGLPKDFSTEIFTRLRVLSLDTPRSCHREQKRRVYLYVCHTPADRLVDVLGAQRGLCQKHLCYGNCSETELRQALGFIAPTGPGIDARKMRLTCAKKSTGPAVGGGAFPGLQVSQADLITEQIDARQFNPRFPKVFPRFVQHAIWQYCSESGRDVCNGNRIDDSSLRKQKLPRATGV